MVQMETSISLALHPVSLLMGPRITATLGVRCRSSGCLSRGQVHTGFLSQLSAPSSLAPHGHSTL